ncbi:hypothetical protein BJ165DRAFT_572615 [Panaeolus papilionaceus]|nr:hypothetical protein BJ165DRAFT_572615 [Panaeolus papilionaceus]
MSSHLCCSSSRRLVWVHIPNILATTPNTPAHLTLTRFICLVAHGLPIPLVWSNTFGGSRLLSETDRVRIESGCANVCGSQPISTRYFCRVPVARFLDFLGQNRPI